VYAAGLLLRMDQGDGLSFDDRDERAGRFCGRSDYFIGAALVWRGREMEAVLWFNLTS